MNTTHADVIQLVRLQFQSDPVSRCLVPQDVIILVDATHVNCHRPKSLSYRKGRQ